MIWFIKKSIKIIGIFNLRINIICIYWKHVAFIKSKNSFCLNLNFHEYQRINSEMLSAHRPLAINWVWMFPTQPTKKQTQTTSNRCESELNLIPQKHFIDKTHKTRLKILGLTIITIDKLENEIEDIRFFLNNISLF